MRRAVVGAICAGMITATVVPAFAGTSSGQGAQRSGLSPTSGSSSSQCVQGTGAGPNGFVILNTAGRVAAPVLTNGEVSLKGATPNTTYLVQLGSSNNCLPEGTLTTNTVGNGNAHIQVKPGQSGSYYVVLQDSSGSEVYASGPVTLK